MCKTRKVVDTGGCTTGYGEDDKGGKVCYQCCAEQDKAYMRRHGRITLYLVKYGNGKYEVVNWPGTLRIKAGVKAGNHNIAGSRYDVWFSFECMTWHGVCYGENTQLCHCKRNGQRR